MALHDDTATEGSVAAATRIGRVALTVRDLERSRDFYERVIGLRVSETDGGGLTLCAEAGQALVDLFGDPSATALDRRTTGLYHLAILLPTRPDLALALARLGQARWPLDGASDHLVSEALYLSDPDGNGLEIYRDRPREQWLRTGEQLEMATLPLALDDLLGELSPADGFQALAPADTTIGHVHLQVSELREAETFYHGLLGFDVMARLYPGALFVSAGGYHHHIGMNTWHSAGSPPPPAGAVGLRGYEILLPSEDECQRVMRRLRSAGIQSQPGPRGALVRDPSGNVLALSTG